MAIDLTTFIPRERHPDFVWLGRLRGWLRMTSDFHHPSGLPGTGVTVRWRLLEEAPGAEDHQFFLRELRRAATVASALALVEFETLARVLADGPKVFRPNDEQWEAMEHVALRLAPRDFRAPYPAFLVEVPAASRRRLAEAHGVPLAKAPSLLLVRDNREPGSDPAVFVSVPFQPEEESFIFSDQPGNPTIEEAICRSVDSQGLRSTDTPEGVAQRGYATDACRAALNLCLLLTHFGARTGPPVDPAAYAKHRSKKHLAHLAHGDCLTVEMTQDIVVRRYAGPAPRAGAPLPPADERSHAPGSEKRSHWREGHWRAWPGYGAARAAGQSVPLVFVPPTLVRADRAVGSLAATEVVYRGS